MRKIIFFLLFATVFTCAAQVPKGKVLADTIYKRLKHGGKFSDNAALFSCDYTTAKNGGKMWEMSDSTKLDKVFWTNVKNLPVGKITKPFKTRFGWHIAEVLERKGRKILFRHILICS